jgi:hypothetical protein
MPRFQPEHSRTAAIIGLIGLIAVRFAPELAVDIPNALLVGLSVLVAGSFAALPVAFLDLEEGGRPLRVGSVVAAVSYPVYWAAGGIGAAIGSSVPLQVVAFVAALTAGVGYAIIGWQLRRLDEVFGHKPRGFGFVYLFFGVVMVVGRITGPIFGAALLGIIFLSDYIVIWIVLIASIVLFRPKDPPGLTPMRPLQ